MAQLFAFILLTDCESCDSALLDKRVEKISVRSITSVHTIIIF